MSNELTTIGIFAAVAIGIVALVIFISRRRSAALRDFLTPLLTAAGWTNLQPLSFAETGLKGIWRSFPVRIGYHARQKRVPQRLIVKVAARTDSRLIVKRKMYGFFGRPFTWFGAPIVELRQPAAQELWVRADEPALAERLFADADVARQIAGNLVAAYDEVKVDRRGLRIMRSLDDRVVREKYSLPTFTMTFEPARFEPIAREELALAETLVTKLMAT